MQSLTRIMAAVASWLAGWWPRLWDSGPENRDQEAYAKHGDR